MLMSYRVCSFAGAGESISDLVARMHAYLERSYVKSDKFTQRCRYKQRQQNYSAEPVHTAIRHALSQLYIARAVRAQARDYCTRTPSPHAPAFQISMIVNSYRSTR